MASYNSNSEDNRIEGSNRIDDDNDFNIQFSVIEGLLEEKYKKRKSGDETGPKGSRQSMG